MTKKNETIAPEVTAEETAVVETTTETEATVEEKNEPVADQTGGLDPNETVEETVEEVEPVAEKAPKKKKEKPVVFNEAKKSNIYKVDPRAINFDNENNPRKALGDMDSLMASIRENGVDSLPAIKVRKTDKNEYSLVHGYRRMNAVMALIAEGVDIARVKVELVNKFYTQDDELVDHLLQNSGKPLTPYEESTIYSSLEKNGWTQSEISKKCGKTQAHVSNMLKVASAPKKVQNALQEGLISTSLVLSIINKHGTKAEEVIVEAVKQIKAYGKTKVTQKVIDAVTEGKEAPKPRTSRYQKIITSAITIATEKENSEQLDKLRKAEEIVSIMDECKTAEDVLEKLMAVL